MTVTAGRGIIMMQQALRAVMVAALLFAAQRAGAQSTLTLGGYTYDGSGNITAIGTDHQYRYDALGRISTASVQGHTQQFTYDRWGNITKIVTDSVTNVFAADPATNRMARVGSTPVNTFAGYDAAGRMTSYLDTVQTFTPDPAGMTKEADIGGRHKVYLYNSSDERIAEIDVAGGRDVASEWTLRDGKGNALRVYRRSDVSGGQWSWKEDYIYGASLLAAEVGTSEGTLHFHGDHLGTPRLITGNGGAKVSLHDYYPFGEEVPPEAQDGERKKYTGHERDGEGIDYMHARYYRNTAGRFQSVDPSRGSVSPERPQSWNRYAYALNDPVSNADPDGRCWVEVAGIMTWSPTTACIEVTAEDPATSRAGQAAAANSAVRDAEFLKQSSDSVWGHGVDGLSIALQGGAAWGGTTGFGFLRDRHTGDWGFQKNGGVGGYGGIGGGLGLQYSYSKSGGIVDGSEWSYAVGGSIDLIPPFSVGGDIMFSPKGEYEGFSIGGGVGEGVTPVELHFIPTYTSVKKANKVNTNPSDFLAYVDREVKRLYQVPSFGVPRH
jgi:RHS repeat-associated protein